MCLFILIFILAGCKRENRITEEYKENSHENVREDLEKTLDNKENKEQEHSDTTKDDTQNDFAKEVKQKELDDARKKREDSINLNSDGTILGIEIKYESELNEEFPLPENLVNQTKQCYNVALKYLKGELKIEPKTKLELYRCYDKDVLKIYTDEDRGFMKDYDTENIYVWEYQEDSGEWSFIFMGREDKSSDWKVVHSGKTYK